MHAESSRGRARCRAVLSTGACIWAATFVVVAVAMIGCHVDHDQSMLHPAGPRAGRIAALWWVLFAVCSATFLLTMALAAIGILRRASTLDGGSPLGNRFIFVSGAAIPAAVLTGILIASLGAQSADAKRDTDFTIQVVGHRYWWEVRYPDQGIVTANEIRIPVGRPVGLELSSGDVIHSFWVPNLAGKKDMLPGQVNRFWIQADRPGIYRGQCAEFCGVQHAWMAFRVVALEPEEFDAWVAAQAPAEEPPVPAEEEIARGREVFFAAHCDGCHAIRGTAAAGKRGPDLSHVGSRLTLAAGVLPNSPENLAEWIRDPQGVKPGNLMPRTALHPDDLDALVQYLQTLK